MPSPEPFLIFTRKLDSLGLRYMVSGSVAAIFYGEPRLTNDVDIILFLKREDAARLPAAFPAGEFYCPPEEVLRLELSREQRGHFNLIHHESGFKADIYLGGRDALHVWGIGHAVEADLGGDKVVFAPPEYVIIRKLQFFREGGSGKHLRDIHRMLLGLGEEWDRATLNRMIEEHGLSAEWQQALTQEN
jgi:hypothetical protein